MPRRPPTRTAPAKPARKGVQMRAHDLPDRTDARRTWSGPPVNRSKKPGRGRWSGTVDYGGRKRHVGTFDTPREWGVARDELLAKLAAGVSVKAPATPLAQTTVSQFVGSKGDGWPYTFAIIGGKRRRQPTTCDHHHQCIQPFVRRFGSCIIKDGVCVDDALDFARTATENQLTSVIALFNDARQQDRAVLNPFQGLSRPRTKGRKELEGVLTRGEVDLLEDIARATHEDEYGVVMATGLELSATSGIRPGEKWALQWPHVDLDRRTARIEFAVKRGRQLGPPKYNHTRTIGLTPGVVSMLRQMPRLSDQWVFPAKRGSMMNQPLWATYWNPLRDAFTMQLPDEHWLRQRIESCRQARLNEPDPELRKRMPNGKLDFYELRHRSATWMATAVEDGGLGLSAAHIAYQFGHLDGGALVESTYIHRSEDIALQRIQEAMQQAHDELPGVDNDGEA